MSVVPRELVNHFITNIFGHVGNLANASHGAVQTSTQVTQGDLAALTVGMKQLGIPENEIEQLKTVLSEERSEAGIGPKTSAWMSKANRAVASGAWKIGTGVTAQAVVKLLTSYLGLG